MQDEKSMFDVAFEVTGDVEESQMIEKWHNNAVDVKSQELAEKKAEKLFETKKEEFRLEVIREIDAANVRAKGAEISSSPYISKQVETNGTALTREHFVPEGNVRDPQYSGDQLMYNDYVRSWQRLKYKGGHDFVSDFVVSVIVVVNATGPGQCQATVVCLRGVESPLFFKDGIIDPGSVKHATAFSHKGLRSSDKLVFQSFIRAMKMCENFYFLTIPEHSGGYILPSGEYCYTSAQSMITGLESLYPEEIRRHRLLQHDRKFEDVIADYRGVLPKSSQAKLGVVIREMSILLPFYEAEGFKPDRFFVFSPCDEQEKKTLIALISRYNYTTPVVTSVSGRITKIRELLSTGNDATILFTYSYCENNPRAFYNVLREIRMDVTGENGIQHPTRKIIGLITDVPGNVPEEYPAYYLSFAERVEKADVQALRHLSGEMDYSLIQFLTNNPDAAKSLIRQALQEARERLTFTAGIERSETMMMLVATSIMLGKFGMVSDTDQQAILHWFETEATSRMTVTEDVCQRFQAAVSRSVLSGELRVARQSVPPYYSDDGRTVFIADKDGSINFTDDVLRKVILPQIPTVKNVAQLNKRLIEMDWVITKHTNKRSLKVTYDSGVQEPLDVYSYCRKVMSTEARAFVDDMIYRDFWFDRGAEPDGFVPVLSNDDGSKVAGYVLTEKMDVNRHVGFFGITRTGKSFAQLQTALMRAARGETVLIFDQAGSYTISELEKHLGKDMVQEFFCHWEVYRNGLPVDLTSLEGCQGHKEKKERLTRVYALLAGKLGSKEERYVNSAVKKMLRDRKKNPSHALSDIVEYIKSDQDAYGDPIKDDAHRNLLYKLEEIFDDLSETPDTGRNWDEFVKERGKRMIVISTGADSVGKGSELIDAMLESLYNFKQCHPDEHYTVILDEVQDLCLHEKGTVNSLLRKVGKDNVSMLLASQAFPDPNIPLGNVMGNCGRIRGYRPKENDALLAAKFFECDTREVDALRQGECFDKGVFYSKYRRENVVTTLRGRTIVFSSDIAS